MILRLYRRKNRTPTAESYVKKSILKSENAPNPRTNKILLVAIRKIIELKFVYFYTVESKIATIILICESSFLSFLHNKILPKSLKDSLSAFCRFVFRFAVTLTRKTLFFVKTHIKKQGRFSLPPRFFYLSFDRKHVQIHFFIKIIHITCYRIYNQITD